MSDLKDIFVQNEARQMHKWHHYFDIYERYFQAFRGKEVVVVEIGVWHGGSLKMWKDYFGHSARIIGIDIDPRCKQLEDDGFEIYIGSQADKDFLEEMTQTIPKIDILIDDGGHMMRQQRTAFEILFPHIAPAGLYLVEDVHTSYWLKFGGGYRRRGTFIEYCKGLIDDLHAYHSQQSNLQVTSLTKSLAYIHFYDSVVILEKALQPKVAPTNSTTGKIKLSADSSAAPLPTARRRFKRLVAMLLRPINYVLRFFRLPGFIWR